MEDDVYICLWKKTEAGFRLWVKGMPQLYVEGDGNVVELSGLLSQQIVESGGAQHAVLQFDKPLPKSTFDARYSTPDIYSICGDERFEVDCPNQNDRAWFDSFFTRPHCRDCGAQSAPRNERSFTLSHVRPDFDGGFVSCCNCSLLVFSDEFLQQHMTLEERDNLHLVPVHVARPCKKQYYELIGPSGPSWTAVSTLEIRGWRCDTCGYQTFGYWDSRSDIHQLLARENLPNPLPEILTVGTAPDVELCMTADRWSQIVGKPGARGLIASQIGTAPAADVIATPELLTQREQARLLRQRRNVT